MEAHLNWFTRSAAERLPFVMIKKLTKHGNSLALVIDRPILDRLNIQPDTPLDVSTDEKQLIVAPAKPATSSVNWPSY
jgi:antitoxin component of MazEF toxin-antitoxin module